LNLARIDAGSGLANKLKLAAMRLVTGERAPDVVRVILYRPEFFGRPFNRCVHRLLRGISEFTLGERELFAAFVSHSNNCAFCYGIHRSVAARVLGDDVVSHAFDDPSTAPVTPQVRASLVFLRKLTTQPSTITGEDVASVRASGVTDAGIEGLINICYVFSAINRIADSLGFEVPSASGLTRTAKLLLQQGYTQV
jgi:uncharacterized peroxidase-related enzyme